MKSENTRLKIDDQVHLPSQCLILNVMFYTPAVQNYMDFNRSATENKGTKSQIGLATAFLVLAIPQL